MTRYIMIESNSGYVWFDTADIGARDETPAEACKRMDEELKVDGERVYEAHGSGYRLSGDGYYVYEAAENFPLAHDPSSQAGVAAVEDNCNLVAVVTSAAPPDELQLTWWQHYAPPTDNEDPADWAEAEAEYLKDLR